ncbi:hypothetical protein MNBD_NITROSPINAE01-1898 [hydrothermal vent metagenome]|uniref:VOC domain-containing protein n=1 Tax=hydrothermal vent metagenome TaxID=652676 RepID=A0A3B1C601_9ZZZZ
MGNVFGWVELITHDTEGAKKFYGELFDWTLKDEEMPGGNYTMIDTGQCPGGGIMKTPEEGVPTHWGVYIETSNIVEACAKIVTLGGQVIKEPFDIPDVGTLAVALDPQGAVFQLWQGLAKK